MSTSGPAVGATGSHELGPMLFVIFLDLFGQVVSEILLMFGRDAHILLPRHLTFRRGDIHVECLHDGRKPSSRA